MQRISSPHWVAFVAMLREVEEATGTLVNYENIEHVLVMETGGTFRENGRMLGCAAIKDHDFLAVTSGAHFPLLGVSCLGPQAARRGVDGPTFALKIVDLRGRPIDDAGDPPV
ncbi:hypothetical protein EBS80_02275, partial [bacterium]|nr:hypothetical protein [bacterium]